MTEELKQKAEEWMRNNSERCTNENMNGYDFAIATCIAVTTEATKELQEEVNEWKSKFENLQKYLDTQNCYRECAETWEKLTKAKELLKQFLKARNGEDTYKAEWEAEQFLKEQNYDTFNCL